MVQRLDEGTVVTVRYVRDAADVELTCVVIGVLQRFVQLLPVTPTRAPAVDTLVELSSGSVQFRATVQDSSNDVFSVLRPIDVLVGRAG